MGHGLYKQFVKTMASADSLVTFDLGRAFSRAYLQIPTMTSTSALDVYVAADSGTTFYQLRKEVTNSSTAQMFSFIIAATAAANGSVVPLPAGFQYFRFYASDSAPTAATTFKVICGD